MNGFLAELKVQQTIRIFKEMYLPKYERLVEGLIYGKTIKKAIGGGEFWVTIETVVNLLILSEVGTQNDLNVRSNIMTKLSGYLRFSLDKELYINHLPCYDKDFQVFVCMFCKTNLKEKKIIRCTLNERQMDFHHDFSHLSNNGA